MSTNKGAIPEDPTWMRNPIPACKSIAGRAFNMRCRTSIEGNYTPPTADKFEFTPPGEVKLRSGLLLGGFSVGACFAFVDSFGEFSEESLVKARRALNDLVEQAPIASDDMIFKCKGFQEVHRESPGQVRDLERIEAASIEGISQKEQEIVDAEALLANQTKLNNIEYVDNKAEMKIRQNDLEIFQCTLVFTECRTGTALSRTGMNVYE